MDAKGAVLSQGCRASPREATRTSGLIAMETHRFGRKIKLHSTLAIKHQILTMMLEEEIRAVPAGSEFDPSTSPALESLRILVPNRFE